MTSKETLFHSLESWAGIIDEVELSWSLTFPGCPQCGGRVDKGSAHRDTSIKLWPDQLTYAKAFPWNNPK